MRIRFLVVLVVLGLAGNDVLAQGASGLPALELPVGSRVRVRTPQSGEWVRGILAGTDALTVALVPEESSPLGDNRLRLPRESVVRLEVLTGRKSRWLPGLLVGAAVGVATGFDEPVDAAQCQYDPNTFCSRASAVAAMGFASAVLGGLVGKLIKSDVWTPVALDALGPPRDRRIQAGVGLRPIPGGVGLAASVRF